MCIYIKGAVLVTTSNRHPNDLYKNGIQRDLFVPCIKRIQVSHDAFIRVTLLNHVCDTRPLQKRDAARFACAVG